MHTIPSFGFLLTEASKPGNLDAKRLKKDGLAPGPLFAKLKAGNVVESGGKSFRPEDYISASSSGKSFLFLGDTCDASTAVNLVNEQNPKNNKLFIVHETTLENKLQDMAYRKGHSTPNMAAEFALAVSQHAQKCTLILDHFSQRYFDEDDPKRTEPDPCTGTLKREAETALGVVDGAEKSGNLCEYSVVLAKDQLLVPLR